MQIKNTQEVTQQDWATLLNNNLEGFFVQGGGKGLVINRKGDNYTTAFVEVHHANFGFIRGEGATIADAELSAWNKASVVMQCEKIKETGEHEYETRGYTNGAGICVSCNHFGTEVFDVKVVGNPCYHCGERTNWISIRNETKKETFWLCQAHSFFSSYINLLDVMEDYYYVHSLSGNDVTVASQKALDRHGFNGIRSAAAFMDYIDEIGQKEEFRRIVHSREVDYLGVNYLGVNEYMIGFIEYRKKKDPMSLSNVTTN